MASLIPDSGFLQRLVGTLIGRYNNCGNRDRNALRTINSDAIKRITMFYVAADLRCSNDLAVDDTRKALIHW